MKVMPLEDWTAYVVGQLHKYKIRNSSLADRCGFSPAYLSTVLNGNKEFSSEVAAVKTRDKILTCLAELIDELEVVEVNPDELNYRPVEN